MSTLRRYLLHWRLVLSLSSATPIDVVTSARKLWTDHPHPERVLLSARYRAWVVSHLEAYASQSNAHPHAIARLQQLYRDWVSATSTDALVMTWDQLVQYLVSVNYDSRTDFVCEYVVALKSLLRS